MKSIFANAILLLSRPAIFSFFSRASPTAKSGSALELYMEALKNENDERMEEAFALYERALVEAQKSRRNNAFKNKIVDKLRLLHTVIEYNQSFASGSRVSKDLK